MKIEIEMELETDIQFQIGWLRWIAWPDTQILGYFDTGWGAVVNVADTRAGWL